MLADDLSARSDELGKIISQAKENLANAPEGTLRVLHTKTKTQYYWRTEKSGPNGQYIPISNQEFIRQLAQKSYDTKAVRLATKQKNAIDQLLNNPTWGLKRHPFNGLPARLHPQKRSMITPYEMSDDEFAQKWAAEEYPRKPFPYGAPILLTERGERVRSKSEIIIANTLHSQGIPYYYEKPIRLWGDMPIHPDFTVLNKRTRHEFLWEHLGMMGDSDYSAKALNRIEQYSKYDYYPGVNLIITHETPDRPLDTNIILQTIKVYLT